MAAKKDKSRRLSSRDLLGARDKADKSAKAIRGSSALQRLSHTSLSVNYTDKYLEYCRRTTRLEPQYKFMRTKLYQNLLDSLEVKEMNQLTPHQSPFSMVAKRETIEGLRTRKVKKHKHVRTRMVKKHTLGEFQFSSPNVTLVCPLKTKMTVLKNMKNVLFYLSWQHAFVLQAVKFQANANWRLVSGSRSTTSWATGNTAKWHYWWRTSKPASTLPLKCVQGNTLSRITRLEYFSPHNKNLWLYLNAVASVVLD